MCLGLYLITAQRFSVNTILFHVHLFHENPALYKWSNSFKFNILIERAAVFSITIDCHVAAQECACVCVSVQSHGVEII